VFNRVDQRDLVSPLAQGAGCVKGDPQSDPIATNAAENYRDVECHGELLGSSSLTSVRCAGAWRICGARNMVADGAKAQLTNVGNGGSKGCWTL
jgi:hypothetical protein